MAKKQVSTIQCLSRILALFHPRSRIPNKFYEIENYLIFLTGIEKDWADRNKYFLTSKFFTKLSDLVGLDPGSVIRDPEKIPGSRIWIRSTGTIYDKLGKKAMVTNSQ